MAYRLISNLFSDGDEERTAPGHTVYKDWKTASDACDTLAERYPNAEVDVEEIIDHSIHNIVITSRKISS